MKRQAIWLAAVMALLVALLAVAGTALAQVEGVNNEAEVCVGESCNSGNVAEVEVEGGGLGLFLNLGVIVGDSNLTVNDAFNTDVSITQIQEGGPAAPINVPGMPAVSGVNNEAETCVGGSCNSGNVAEVEIENGLGISIGSIIDSAPIPIEEGFEALQDRDGGLLEIELPCTIVAVNVGVIGEGITGDGEPYGSDLDVNAACNTSVGVDQSQG